MIGVPLEQAVLLNDRFNAHVTLSKEAKTYEKSLGSRFVFGLESELVSESLSIKGTFAAVVNDTFEIKAGTALVIHTLGYTSIEQKAILLPTVPFLGESVRLDGRSCLSKFFQSGTAPMVEYLFIPHNSAVPEEQAPSCRIGFVLGGEGHLTSKPESFILHPGSAFILQRYERFNFNTHVNPLGILFFNPDPRSYPKKGPSW